MKIFLLVACSSKDSSTMANYMVSKKQAVGERYYLLRMKDQSFFDLENYLSDLFEKTKSEYDGIVMFSKFLLDKKIRNTIQSFFETISPSNEVEIIPLEGKWTECLCSGLSQQRDVNDVIEEFEKFNHQFSYQYNPDLSKPKACIVDETILDALTPFKIMISSLYNQGYKILLVKNTSTEEIDESELIIRFNEELGVNVIVFPKIPKESRKKYLYRLSAFWNLNQAYNVELVLESDASTYVEFWKANVPVICIDNPYRLDREV